MLNQSCTRDQPPAASGSELCDQCELTCSIAAVHRAAVGCHSCQLSDWSPWISKKCATCSMRATASTTFALACKLRSAAARAFSIWQPTHEHRSHCDNSESNSLRSEAASETKPKRFQTCMSTALVASKVDASTRFGSIVSAALSCQAKQSTAHVSRRSSRSRLTHRHSFPPRRHCGRVSAQCTPARLAQVRSTVGGQAAKATNTQQRAAHLSVQCRVSANSATHWSQR